MGADVDIYLPPNVRVRDVAAVMGIAAGLPPQRRSLQGGGWYAEVPGATVAVCESIPEMVRIHLQHPKGKPLVDGDSTHFSFYHFEHASGLRCLNPRSTPFWIAVAHRLVDFFGGWIDYNDCDDSEKDYEKPARSNEENHPEDGAEWDAFQERVFAVRKITRKEMQAAAVHAAYPGLLTSKSSPKVRRRV